MIKYCKHYSSIIIILLFFILALGSAKDGKKTNCQPITPIDKTFNITLNMSFVEIPSFSPDYEKHIKTKEPEESGRMYIYIKHYNFSTTELDPCKGYVYLEEQSEIEFYYPDNFPTYQFNISGRFLDLQDHIEITIQAAKNNFFTMNHQLVLYTVNVEDINVNLLMLKKDLL